MISIRPSYYASPYHIPETETRVENHFGVYEIRGTETRFLFKMSNRGDRLNEIVKRGIPLEDARVLFYQMDE